MSDANRKRTPRERAHQEIELLDALKKLERDGLIQRVVRSDGEIGYKLVNNDHKRCESDNC